MKKKRKKKEYIQSISRTQSRLNAESIKAVMTREKVAKCLAALCPSKSMGADGVHPSVLRYCAEALAPALTHIFRLSIEEGRIPDKWRLGNLTSIYKKGNRSCPANYRPVSLTSVVCKVMEALIREVIMQFLISNSLLAPEQHGFVPRKACVTNLLETIDSVTREFANGQPVDLVYLDFAKAFDTVPHKRLLVKLKAYGLDEQLCTWLMDFLRDRKQRVVMGECESEWMDVTSGVPQGSVLGPLLFLLYINDLPGLWTNKSKFYADDGKIIGQVGTEEGVRTVQNDLDAVSDWVLDWLMQLNCEKCAVVHIGKRNPNSTYTIRKPDGIRVELRKSEGERDLGVRLDNELGFSQHIRAVTSKANSMIGMLKNAFVCRDSELWKKLYVSLIRPHLEYAVSVWNPRLRRDIDALERVQKRVLRIPHDLREMAGYKERLRSVGLTTLEVRRDRGDLIQAYKLIKGLEQIDNYCIPKSAPSLETNGPSSALRRRNNLVRESFKTKQKNDNYKATTIRHHFFTNRVVPLWNGLPNDVTSAQTLPGFKMNYDAFMTNRLVGRGY